MKGLFVVLCIMAMILFYNYCDKEAKNLNVLKLNDETKKKNDSLINLNPILDKKLKSYKLYNKVLLKENDVVSHNFEDIIKFADNCNEVYMIKKDILNNINSEIIFYKYNQYIKNKNEWIKSKNEKIEINYYYNIAININDIDYYFDLKENIGKYNCDKYITNTNKSIKILYPGIEHLGNYGYNEVFINSTVWVGNNSYYNGLVIKEKSTITGTLTGEKNSKRILLEVENYIDNINDISPIVIPKVNNEKTIKVDDIEEFETLIKDAVETG